MHSIFVPQSSNKTHKSSYAEQHLAIVSFGILPFNTCSWRVNYVPSSGLGAEASTWDNSSYSPMVTKQQPRYLITIGSQRQSSSGSFCLGGDWGRFTTTKTSYLKTSRKGEILSLRILQKPDPPYGVIIHFLSFSLQWDILPFKASWPLLLLVTSIMHLQPIRQFISFLTSSTRAAAGQGGACRGWGWAAGADVGRGPSFPALQTAQGSW